MLDGAIYRTVSNQSGNSAGRNADMDAMQVEHQVLSPMPELLSY
jgi:aminocarboxymuconate-semialdehyde decarboxylase